MSSNPFAALDDSGDEAPIKSKKSNSKTIAPSSKPDPKSKPQSNDRNTKHGRGGRPPARDGKRQYDRRSGTGRGKEIKKGGGGARNWGSDKNEARKMEGRINEEDEIASGADADDNAADIPAEEVEPPKEDNTMTYAEYITSKVQKEEVSLRETKNEFAGVTAASKGEEESFIAMGGGKKKKDKKKKEVEKKTIDLGFRAANADDGRGSGRGDRRDSRGRGGRDGRGRGRGGGRDGRGRGRGGRGGRGSGRGANKKPQGLNVQDMGAFPSL